MVELYLTSERREEIKSALLDEIQADTPAARGSIGYLADLYKMKIGDEIPEDHSLRDVIELFQLDGATLDVDGVPIE